MITYTCDGEFLSRLEYIPAQDHEPGEFIEIRGRDGKLRGKVKQASHTYAVVGLMNEHQLAICETTFGGRSELRNPDGLLHYFFMMRLALQRAKTARESLSQKRPKILMSFLLRLRKQASTISKRRGTLATLYFGFSLKVSFTKEESTPGTG